jgi:hypothetical protein
MMREKVMPRELGVDADGNSIVLVGADVAVESVGFALRKVRGNLFEERVKNGRFDRLIGVAPVDMLLAGRLLDEKFVFRRASRVGTRIDDQLSVVPDNAFATAYCMFDQFGNAEVVPKLGGLEFFRNGKNCSTLANKRLRMVFPERVASLHEARSAESNARPHA